MKKSLPARFLRLSFALAISAVASTHAVAQKPNTPKNPNVSLRETLTPSALIDAAATRGQIIIKGSANTNGAKARVLARVTDARGRSTTARFALENGAFRGAYPRDFRGAEKLAAGAFFIDATLGNDFNAHRAGHFQAEAAVLVYDSARKTLPDLPSVFTNDLFDRFGKRDQSSSEWPAVRALANLYMRSQAARAIGVGKPDFDLARPADFANFKNNFALYDFDNRDRDWRVPLGARTHRTYWQSVWNTWFNSTNNNPLDGNPKNQSPSNFVPYAFANDFADILIAYQMRRKTLAPMDDNLVQMNREATENLMAMQHKTPDNFALRDTHGRQETYTAGAFRYGMFETGDFMREGYGWFYNPAFLDYIAGGALNARALWGLAESLKAEPNGPQAPRLKAALQLGIRFCLRDAVVLGYARRTTEGNVYWRDPGEHAYLAVAMIAASEVAPDLEVVTADGVTTLRDASPRALNALLDLRRADGTWAIYTNYDSMAIVALSDGIARFPRDANVTRWKAGAQKAADAWMNARPPKSEFSAPMVHFGLYLGNGGMTFNWYKLSQGTMANRNIIYFYLSGHWIHALSRLYAVTGEMRYRRRSEAMFNYLCGDNPWRVRLFNEFGGVYNWVEDMDGDGTEDFFKQDMYPESTAFTQIGIFHLLQTLSKVKK